MDSFLTFTLWFDLISISLKDENLIFVSYPFFVSLCLLCYEENLVILLCHPLKAVYLYKKTT